MDLPSVEMHYMPINIFLPYLWDNNLFGVVTSWGLLSAEIIIIRSAESVAAPIITFSIIATHIKLSSSRFKK